MNYFQEKVVATFMSSQGMQGVIHVFFAEACRKDVENSLGIGTKTKDGDLLLLYSNNGDNHWHLEFAGGPIYKIGYIDESKIASKMVILSRTDGELTVTAKNIEESYSGLNGSYLLLDEPDLPSYVKMNQIRQGFTPLLWCLPSDKTEEYFSALLKTCPTNFSSTFMNKNFMLLTCDELKDYPLGDIIVNVSMAPIMHTKIKKWYIDNMGYVP